MAAGSPMRARARAALARTRGCGSRCRAAIRSGTACGALRTSESVASRARKSLASPMARSSAVTASGPSRWPRACNAAARRLASGSSAASSSRWVAGSPGRYAMAATAHQRASGSSPARAACSAGRSAAVTSGAASAARASSPENRSSRTVIVAAPSLGPAPAGQPSFRRGRDGQVVDLGRDPLRALVDQHDGNVVADGVFAVAVLADKPGVLDQRQHAGLIADAVRAAQNFEQIRAYHQYPPGGRAHYTTGPNLKPGLALSARAIASSKVILGTFPENRVSGPKLRFGPDTLFSAIYLCSRRKTRSPWPCQPGLFQSRVGRPTPKGRSAGSRQRNARPAPMVGQVSPPALY